MAVLEFNELPKAEEAREQLRHFVSMSLTHGKPEDYDVREYDNKYFLEVPDVGFKNPGIWGEVNQYQEFPEDRIARQQEERLSMIRQDCIDFYHQFEAQMYSGGVNDAPDELLATFWLDVAPIASALEKGYLHMSLALVNRKLAIPAIERPLMSDLMLLQVKGGLEAIIANYPEPE